MSHIVTIKAELRSLEAIKAACNRLGWAFNEGQTTYRWFGTWMGDSPIPEDLLTETQLAEVKALDSYGQREWMSRFMGNCNHAITVPGCTYDIGILEHTDSTGRKQFKLAYDYWPGGGLHEKMPTEEGDNNLFAQAYALELARAQALTEGYSVEEQVQDNGTIVLTMGDYR